MIGQLYTYLNGVIVPMFIKRFEECKEIVALDNTIVREFLNPLHDKGDLHLDYSLAHATVKPREASLPHRFKTASEVYYILRGTGRMHINDESKRVQPGDTVYIPPRGIQFIENIGDDDLEFLCIVYPSWKPDAEDLV